ncbi:hypothetical protein [Sphingomonas oleivorans]|nr:hypothetical protein [Sphingomonas oleivorans]
MEQNPPTGQRPPGTSIAREREIDPGATNRGQWPGEVGGMVTGSGAGAGGGGAPEDYDEDPAAGGGKVELVSAPHGPMTGADAPEHGSR